MMCEREGDRPEGSVASVEKVTKERSWQALGDRALRETWSV